MNGAFAVFSKQEPWHICIDRSEDGPCISRYSIDFYNMILNHLKTGEQIKLNIDMIGRSGWSIGFNRNSGASYFFGVNFQSQIIGRSYGYNNPKTLTISEQSSKSVFELIRMGWRIIDAEDCSDFGIYSAEPICTNEDTQCVELGFYYKGYNLNDYQERQRLLRR